LHILPYSLQVMNQAILPGQISSQMEAWPVSWSAGNHSSPKVLKGSQEA